MATNYDRIGIVGILSLPSSTVSDEEIPIVVSGNHVEHNGDPVVIFGSGIVFTRERIVYLTLGQEGTNPSELSFSTQYQHAIYDWTNSLNGGGIDSPGFLQVSYAPKGDYQRQKSLPYVTFHLKATPDTPVTLGTYTPSSSCRVSTAWDWGNSYYKGAGGFGNRWSKEFQAYRYRRSTNVDSHDWALGETVISSRHKVRGSGKVFSFVIETDPGKDCQLQGWSTVVSGNGNV